MNEDEVLKVLAESVLDLHESLRSIEVVQQFIARHLHIMSPESAALLANDLENVAKSDKVEVSESVRRYMLHISKSLNGNLDVPIIGLLKPVENSKDPIHWLRGVIDGGKGKNS